MTVSKKSKSTLAVGLIAGPLALMVAGVPAAMAASDGTITELTNTETIQARMDASGKVTEARVYEQIAVTGDGRVEIVNPVSTKGLRNLDGFSGFKVEGDRMVATVDVKGRQRLRTVSDYTKDLPLNVEVTYELNGKQVDPKKVVGASGDLRVTYRVTNMTAEKRSVAFDDGTGKQITEDVDVVIPMVGSLTTTVPANFTDVRSEQANIAGDGRGGTKLSFTMTLFPPIGSETVEFGYTARIRDGVVPPASISALPVKPLQSPSFKAGAESYAGGADTGAQLTAGAVEIDTNLLKLRDGASELLAGLVQLRDGAEQLRDGLQGEAAPGARQLASGAGKLDKGANDLASGSKQLDTGAKKLATGSGDAKAGADKLAAGAGQLNAGLSEAGAKAPALLDGLKQVDGGLAQVDAGLEQLYGGIGQLPEKAKPLHQGIALLRSGIGDKDTDKTLVYGVDQLRQQLGTAAAGLQLMADGAYKESADDPGSYQRLGCAVQLLDDTLTGTLANGRAGKQDPCYADTPTNGVVPPMDGISAAELPERLFVAGVRDKLSESRKDIFDSSNPASTDTLYGGLKTLQTRLEQGAVPALTQIECGLDNTTLDACTKIKDDKGNVKLGLLQGIDAVDDGVTALVSGVVGQVQGAVGLERDVAKDKTLRGGVHSLQSGVDQINAGGQTLLSGLGRLGAGSGQLSSGASDLAAGLGQISGGARQLSDGTGKLKTGAGQLAGGTGQLKDGAGKLANGLGDAADGSGQLADGLVQAADGAPQIVDGAQRLSTEGMGALTEAGKSTAQEFGSKYALIEAVNERAASEGMAYGAPEGANGLTAYSLELAGESGEGGRNMARGLGALAVFGLGAGLVAGVRNRFF